LLPEELSTFHVQIENHRALHLFNPQNGTNHPIDLHGTVKSKRSVKGKNEQTNVLKLAIPKIYRGPRQSRD